MSSEVRRQIEIAIKDMPTVTPIGSTRPVKASLPEAVEKIVNTLEPERIILFGSYATGSPTPDSDVDLLVVLKTDLSDKSERHWQVSKLLIPRPFPVDILVNTPDELNRALGQNHYFYRDVVDSGKVLYERRR